MKMIAIGIAPKFVDAGARSAEEVMEDVVSVDGRPWVSTGAVGCGGDETAGSAAVGAAAGVGTLAGAGVVWWISGDGDFGAGPGNGRLTTGGAKTIAGSLKRKNAVAASSWPVWGSA
jgi:hypothetical protein